MISLPRLCRKSSSRSNRRAAFTLTELLIVIALIALLVGLLLAALGQVQAKARKTTTVGTMEAFKNACEAFRQEHGYYPGVVPEDVLDNDPQISGTENALLHLVGGYVLESDPNYNDATMFPPADWTELTFSTPLGGMFRMKLNPNKFGDGPVINGKPYAPYFTPGEREFARVEGDLNAATTNLPDLVDAWGQPVIYLRRVRPLGPLTSTTVPAQFLPGGMLAYTQATALGNLGQNQEEKSIFSTSLVTPVVHAANLARIIQQPAITSEARGAIALISAGPDGIYFSTTDGIGDSPNPAGDLSVNTSPNIVEEYDDVISFGGS